MDTTGLYVHDLNPSPFDVILGTVGQAVTMAVVTQGCGFQECHCRGVTHRGLVWGIF